MLAGTTRRRTVLYPDMHHSQVSQIICVAVQSWGYILVSEHCHALRAIPLSVLAEDRQSQGRVMICQGSTLDEGSRSQANESLR